MTQRRLITAVLVFTLVAAAHAATREDRSRPQSAASSLHVPAVPFTPVPVQLLPGGFSGGGLSGAAANVRADVGGGAVVIAKLAGTLIDSVVRSTGEGTGPVAGALSAVRRVLDPAFLLGNIPGGILGGALGAALPLPAFLGNLGLAGQMLRFAPALAGAVLGSAAGMHAIDLARDGQLTRERLAERMDVKQLLVQTAAMSVTIILARAYLPPLMLGAVSATEIAAALAGAWGASKIFNRFRGRPDKRGSSMLASGLEHHVLPTITGTASAKHAADAYQRFLEAERAGRVADARDAYRAYQSLAR